MRDIVMRAAKRFLRFTKMSGPDNIGGPCPFHKEGQEKKPSFYINLNNGMYYCHSCGAKGTFKRFLRRMGASEAYTEQVMEEVKQAPKKKPENPFKRNVGFGEHFLNESILGVFQYCPTGLVEDGFDPKLLKRLEVGFDRHLMRITFPIRDLDGKLVGITGRTVIGDDEKYHVYKGKDLLQYAPDDHDVRERYEKYDIKNHDYLWNGHQVYPLAFSGELDTVIVVEGYKACIWLIQQGVDNVVALQGSRMTRAQERLLTRLGVTIILFLDNNKAGKEGTDDTARRLIKQGLRVLCVKYPPGCDEHTQPDNLDQATILGVLDAADSWPSWRIRNGILRR